MQAHETESMSSVRCRPTRSGRGAAGGEFDAVVAMYHDQGHIAMKMRGGRRR